MRRMKKHVLILGGGLAGMSCALGCARAGLRVTILERESEVGGLARSFSQDGFTFDFGPHRLFSQQPELIRELGELLGGDLTQRDRRSRIFLKGRFFHYPLRVGNAIFSMPPLTTARILLDYGAAKARGLVRKSPDRSFEDWVVSRFGATLYRIFFQQYTEKAWGIPCATISADWASQRISLLSLWDTFVKSVWKRGDQPRTYASSFHYPRTGGIGRIARTMAAEVERLGGTVRCACPVEAIRLENGRVTSVRAGGESFSADEVISTLPITDFTRFLGEQVPPEARRAAAALTFRAIVFVYLFLDRPSLSDDHWIYLPENRFLSNRLCESRNFSEQNAPPQKTVVCAEVTCAVGDEIWRMGDEELSAKVRQDLLNLGFAAIRPEEILAVRTIRAPECYPIYDIGYKERVEAVLRFAAAIPNLLPIGRSALFRYNNMDHSVDMGLRAARALLGQGSREEALAVASGAQYFG